MRDRFGEPVAPVRVMKLLTALRWINGATLLMALSVWLLYAALQWMGRFVKGAAQTAWNTGVMFASGFQKNPVNPPVPGVEWETLWTIGSLAALWISVFLPSRVWWMHGCALGAGLLAAWNVWMLRGNPLGQATLVALGIWFSYYWAAMWRS